MHIEIFVLFSVASLAQIFGIELEGLVHLSALPLKDRLWEVNALRLVNIGNIYSTTSRIDCARLWQNISAGMHELL